MDMMRRILYLLAAAVCMPLCHAGAQGLDSLRRNALETRLGEYFGALEHETPEFKMQECDFLVGSCTDSLVRQFVALEAYGHYLDSPVMGDEAVAIYILDKWFFSGKVKMRSDEELMYAKVFADFNRNSLIGMKAPQLQMYGPDGSQVTVFGDDDPGGRIRVMYFYDTGCAKCKLETAMLRNLLSSGDYAVDLYAVYSGDDKDAWDGYRATRLGDFPADVRVFHLWDPDLESDFQRKWGVLVMPRLFLVSPDGTIIGRGLTASALGQMLDRIFRSTELEYGSEESAALFDGMFAASGETVTKDDVAEIADRIAWATLEKGDTLMFRQMSGDLLYYLSDKSGEGYKEGTRYLIGKYIKDRGDIWKTQDDTLKITGLSLILDDLLSKALPGTLLPDVKVPGRLLSAGKAKEGVFSLRRPSSGRHIIIFHTEGCPYCSAEIAAAEELVANDRKLRVLLVNVDMIAASGTELSEVLFDAFDLSSLPLLVETDRKGRVVRRYFSLCGQVRP